MKQYVKREIEIPVKEGSMKVIILDHHETKKKVPGVLWIHGGGYITGMASMVEFTRGKDIANLQEAVVFSPEYRLAPKYPYSYALEDCYACLKYMYDNQEILGIDRFIVGGESARGGLSIATCMKARDLGEIKVDYHIPLYQMIDCLPTITNQDNHAYVWNSKRNDAAWQKYLGKNYQQRIVSYLESPSRCIDYQGLPKAYTFVCDGEPFLQETIDYIDHLNKVGIQAEVDIYHASTHAFDMILSFRKVSKQARKKFNEKINEIFQEIYK